MRDWQAELTAAGLPARSGQLSFLYILAAAVVISLGIFMLWHAFLISTAQTTLEVGKNTVAWLKARSRGEPWINLYHLGSVRKNWVRPP